MSSRMPEKHIQETAVTFLKHYYQQYSHNQHIYANLEETTKQGKRADGLIVWEKAPNVIRVVSVEAKSSATISNLLSSWNTEHLNKSSFFIAQIFILGLFCLGYKFLNIRIPLEPALLVLVFLFLTIAIFFTRYFLQSLLPEFFKTAEVLTQATLYPGNEIWIAIGADTFIMKKEERLQDLIDKCKRRKFGLLEIPIGENSPIIIVPPRFNPSGVGTDFLTYYKNEDLIRTAIAGEKNNWASKYSTAEWQFYVNQIMVSVACTTILFACLFYFSQFRLISKPSIADLAAQLDHSGLESYKPIIDSEKNEEQDGHPPSPLVEKELVSLASSERAPTSTNIVEENTAQKTASQELTLPQKITGQAPLNCNSLPFQGKKFIVKDQLFTTRSAAQKRVKQLLEAGCKTADYFWLPCIVFSKEDAAWCVYAYPARSDKSKVENSFVRYTYMLKQAGLDYSQAEIWMVSNKN